MNQRFTCANCRTSVARIDADAKARVGEIQAASDRRLQALDQRLRALEQAAPQSDGKDD